MANSGDDWLPATPCTPEYLLTPIPIDIRTLAHFGSLANIAHGSYSVLADLCFSELVRTEGDEDPSRGGLLA